MPPTARLVPLAAGWALACAPALLCAGPLAAAQETPSPTIVVGDLADLEAKVLDSGKPESAGLLVVEVRNRSRRWVEPLAFELVLEPAKDNSKLIRRHSLQRVPSPLAGRAGRAARPGGTERWWLPRPYTGDERVRWEVRVVAASFFEGKGWTRCPVELSELRDSRGTLHNSAPHPVRVLLRAPPTEQGLRLFAEDLLPGEDRVIGAEQRPAMNVALPPELPPVHGSIETLEIVDWSVLVDPAETAARAMMREAWQRLARWESPRDTLLATVEYRMEGEAWALPGRGYRGRTEFELHPEDGVHFPAQAKLQDAERSLLQSSIARAFEPLTRPDFDSWAGSQVFQRDDGCGRPRLFLPWNEQGVSSMLRHLTLAGGLVVHQRGLGIHSALEEQIRYQSTPGGRELPVLVEQSQRTFGVRYPQERRRTRYDFGEGRAWAAEFTIERFAGDGALSGTVQLDFEEVRFEAARVRPSAPAGSGAEALRAAWEVGYRYPAGMRVEARFTVETPDRPADWLGERQTRGRLVFEGWSGGEFPYERGEVEVEGHPPEQAAQMASLFRARQSIWCRMDPAGRRPFELALAGARIEPRKNQPGVFDIEHPRLREARVKDGRIVALGLSDGTDWSWDWGERHGQMVPLRLRYRFGERSSSMQLDWASLDAEAGWLFPSKVRIEDWFFDGWGPEVHSFRLR